MNHIIKLTLIGGILLVTPLHAEHRGHEEQRNDFQGEQRNDHQDHFDRHLQDQDRYDHERLNRRVNDINANPGGEVNINYDIENNDGDDGSNNNNNNN